MPRGGPRGNKRTHKGQRRHFTDESEIKRAAEKEERQKEWRRRQGIESEEEEEVDKVEKGEDGEKVEKGAAAPGDLPPSDSSSEDSDDESDKHKGVSHLIDIENPNRMGGRSTKKVTELQDSKTELTRREREEIEKQQAKANYQKMHIAGKTDEARADLARLAIIRKQREEAAKKKTEEKAKEDAAKKSSKS